MLKNFRATGARLDVTITVDRGASLSAAPFGLDWLERRITAANTNERSALAAIHGAPAAGRVPAKALSILVVDHDVHAAELLEEVFTLEGHAVTRAHTGASAIEKFRETNFDVAFMGAMTPGIDGVEGFLKIRSTKPDAKVFMTTGYSVEQLLSLALENGALGTFARSFSVDDVSENLEAIKSGGIMLVEGDSPHAGAEARDLLAARGHRVHLAHDRQEAVDPVLDGEADVLILDLNQPIIDGLAVYTDLRNRHRAVPTIIVAHPGDDLGKGRVTDAVREMTITGLVTKPYKPETVLDALQRLSA